MLDAGFPAGFDESITARDSAKGPQHREDVDGDREQEADDEDPVGVLCIFSAAILVSSVRNVARGVW